MLDKTMSGTPSPEAMAAWCRLLYERHMVVGVGGNVSAKVEGGVLVTPSGCSFRDVRAEHILTADLDGKVAGSSPYRVSKEFGMHSRIYRRRPDVKCICHVHGAEIVAASAMLPPDGVLPPIAPGYVYFAYPMPTAPFFIPGTVELAAAVEERFADPKVMAVLLRNHGLITVGSSVFEAMTIAEEIDEAAKVFVLLDQNASQIDGNTAAAIRSSR